VKWSVPDGVNVGEFSWPTPERIPVGPLVNYGYHGDVVLPFTIRMPAGLRGRPQVITADVRWLVCKDICVPVNSTVALTLPLDAASQAEAPAWTRLIATARQRVPTRAPPNWRATAADAGDAFLLTVTPDQPASGVVNFFPLHESQVEDAAKQGVQRNGARLTLRLEKSAQLAAMPRELTGVLTIGTGRGFLVSAPVRLDP
jgi:DsbC/DsbD-like thiol-disulfide interchange protein